MLDLDAVCAAFEGRREAWSQSGLALGAFTWRDEAATWPKPLERNREAVADPESLGVTFTGADERCLELTIWRGGWADVNGFDGQAILSEAPSLADVDSCLVVVDQLVARLGGAQKRAGSV